MRFSVPDVLQPRIRWAMGQENVALEDSGKSRRVLSESDGQGHYHK